MYNLFSKGWITSRIFIISVLAVCLLFIGVGGFLFYLFIDQQNTDFLYHFLALVIASLLFFTLLFLLILDNFSAYNRNIKHVLDLMQEPVVIKDWQGKFLFANQFIAKLYGTTPEAMLGKDDFDFSGNRQQSDFSTKKAQKVMANDKPEMVYEDFSDSKTGEIHHFHSLKIPFVSPLGQQNIIVIARDITEITVAKNNAEKDKRRLECVLDASSEGLWEWNTLTNEVLHNKRWELITGVEDSDNSFKEFENCILAEDKAMVKAELGNLLNNSKPYSIEFRMQRPDGKIIWIWDRGRVVETDPQGRPIWLVGIMLDITEQKLNQQKIESLAYYDALTCLPNRASLDKKINELIVQEGEHYNAVLFLDLDRFKLLNDTYGHHMGDRLLVKISERLQQLIADKGMVARFGGDEFVAILSPLANTPEQATEQAQDFAEQLRKEVSLAIELRSEIQDLSIEYAITTSIGGVIFKAEQTSADKLLQLADLALYQVKAEGRNDAIIFDLERQKDLHHTSSLQKTMRNSLDNGDFCIYLQPKYNHRQEITGAEALVRWNHPNHGLIPPVKFISIAEDINLIVPLGNHVLHLACRQLEQWLAEPATQHLTIAVNLSAKQIWQKDFIENMIDIISQYKINNSQLTLEVTESMLLQDMDDAIDKLRILRNYGLQLSLDDFGTGYSSLSYLKSLPIDEIKIDRTFVNDIIDNPQADVMVKSIIDLGENFNLAVVSEGVETKQQFDRLNLYGIKCYQGFYFSKPLTMADFELLLASSVRSRDH